MKKFLDFHELISKYNYKNKLYTKFRFYKL